MSQRTLNVVRTRPDAGGSVAAYGVEVGRGVEVTSATGDVLRAVDATVMAGVGVLSAPVPPPQATSSAARKVPNAIATRARPTVSSRLFVPGAGLLRLPDCSVRSVLEGDSLLGQAGPHPVGQLVLLRGTQVLAQRNQQVDERRRRHRVLPAACLVQL